MAFTLERIEALAPDQSSLAAARKLLKPSGWPTLATGEGLAWGECQGSGATPYRVVVAESDAGYKCSCPSRKFPCKHSLALMWMRAEGKVAFASAQVPEWIKDWLGRRRGPNSTAAADADETKFKPSIRLTEGEPEEAADPKAAARAAAVRDRNRLDREAAILAGLDDLDLWLADQVDRGMASFVAQAASACRVISQRLVDAKASALASRLEALHTRLFTLSEAARPLAAIQELGQVHLISEAYRRQKDLPSPLISDARQATGLPMTREQLLADASALRVTATWRVVATLSEVQPDRLRRVETWLWREGDSEANPRFAVLIDFVPVATGASSSGYSAGDRFEAELTFYPSAVPLRARIVRIEHGALASDDDVAIPALTLGDALGTYETALAQLPWVGTFPLAFQDARIRRAGDSLFLTDAPGTVALPLQSSQATLALPLVTAGRLDGVALWNGYHSTLCWAQTSLGRWVAS